MQCLYVCLCVCMYVCVFMSFCVRVRPLLSAYSIAFPLDYLPYKNKQEEIHFSSGSRLNQTECFIGIDLDPLKHNSVWGILALLPAH